MEARLHQKAAFVAEQLQDLLDRLCRDLAEQLLVRASSSSGAAAGAAAGSPAVSLPAAAAALWDKTRSF